VQKVSMLACVVSYANLRETQFYHAACEARWRGERHA
jgi:hypothetical protein